MKATKHVLAIALAMLMTLGMFAVGASALVPAHVGTPAANSLHGPLAQACGVTVPEFWEIQRLVTLLSFKASIRRYGNTNFFCDGSEVFGINIGIIEGLLPFVKDINDAHGATNVSDPRMVKLAYIAPAYRSGQLLADVRAAQVQLEGLLGVNPDKALVAALANAFCSAIATKEGDYDEYPVPPNPLPICPICTQYNPASSCKLIDINKETAAYTAMVDFCTANHNSIRYWFTGDPTEPASLITLPDPGGSDVFLTAPAGSLPPGNVALSVSQLSTNNAFKNEDGDPIDGFAWEIKLTAGGQVHEGSLPGKVKLYLPVPPAYATQTNKLYVFHDGARVKDVTFTTVNGKVYAVFEVDHLSPFWLAVAKETPAKKFIKLWGKETRWESNFLNWLLCIFAFGWIWMAIG